MSSPKADAACDEAFENLRSRPQLSIRDLLLMVAGVAATCRYTAAAYLSIPAIAYMTTRRFNASRGTRLVLIALAYLPSPIGLRLACSHCRDFWIRFGGVVPGGSILILGRILRMDSPLDGPVAFAVAAVATWGLIVGGVALAGRSRLRAIGAGLLVLAASAFAYVTAYLVIQM